MEHAPTRLGHVHLKVRDLERSVTFYREVLGLSVTERYDGFAFLSFGDRHHDIALQAVGQDAPGPGPGVGLYHAAFEVDDPAALRAIYRAVRDDGRQVTPIDHGISKALYFDDPDGNGLEVNLDPREENDRERWRGQNRRFDPERL